jgi:hypothetical protein
LWKPEDSFSDDGNTLQAYKERHHLVWTTNPSYPTNSTEWLPSTMNSSNATISSMKFSMDWKKYDWC